MFIILRSLFAYLLLCMGTYLMLRLIIDYTSFKTDIHFLAVKQEYIHLSWWKTAFYIHVFFSIFALLAGFTQFSKYILQNYRALHRIIGKMYVIAILFINFPSALVLAVYANGFWPSRLAFIILDCLWFYFTWRAVVAIRQKNIDSHRQFMIRSYALTFSAITLRTWKIILAQTFHPDPVTLYMVEAWIGFVPNLLLAEWWIAIFPNSRNIPAPQTNRPVSQQNLQ